jgi:hypothetical protein
MQVSRRRFLTRLRQRTGYPFSAPPGDAPPSAPRFVCSSPCSFPWNICRDEPVFAEKVTCGVRSETSGQSGPSNTFATDAFTGQNRNSECGSGIQHDRLGGWRPKTSYLSFQTLRYIGMAVRGVLSSLPFSQVNLDEGPPTASMDVGSARLPATSRLPARKPGPLDR